MFLDHSFLCHHPWAFCSFPRIVCWKQGGPLCGFKEAITWLRCFTVLLTTQGEPLFPQSCMLLGVPSFVFRELFISILTHTHTHTARCKVGTMQTTRLPSTLHFRFLSSPPHFDYFTNQRKILSFWRASGDLDLSQCCLCDPVSHSWWFCDSGEETILGLPSPHIPTGKKGGAKVKVILRVQIGELINSDTHTWPDVILTATRPLPPILVCVFDCGGL